MDVFEYKIKLAEEIIEEREFVNNKYLSLKVETIKQFRDLIIQFVIISSGIIGFTLPVFDKTQLVKNKTFLIGGLAELLIIVLFGFYYLKNILEKENDSLEKDSKAFNEYLDKKRDAKIEFIKSLNGHTKSDAFKIYEEENHQALIVLNNKVKTRPSQKDYVLDLVFIAFFLGLALIVLSLTDFNFYFLLKIFNL